MGSVYNAMRVYDIINKKKRGEVLTDEEIRFFVRGYNNGEIPDFQASALLMAICFVGMDTAETASLTMAMAESGETADLSEIGGVTADKHSTGGVGDKTTLAVVPIVAACGVNIAKMSGRGLGHTGGTIDKLESIPGFRTDLTNAEFIAVAKAHGLVLSGQSLNLAPADKKLYALRDVTATVDSIPLIAASIMSKKIAAGADSILLDVKTGSGAFMKTLADAEKLARAMVEIGNKCGRKTAALITDMNIPLGVTIGNALEVGEVVRYLSGGLEQGGLSARLMDLCEELSAHMLYLAGKGDLPVCRDMAREAVASGAALRKFEDMVLAQGGDISAPATAPHTLVIEAPTDGYITQMDTEGIGVAAMLLGAGRELPEDKIDYLAGIVLQAHYGSYVKKGEVLATFYSSSLDKMPQAVDRFLSSITFSREKPGELPLVYKAVC